MSVYIVYSSLVRKLNQNVLEAIYENPRTKKRREEKEKEKEKGGRGPYKGVWALGCQGWSPSARNGWNLKGLRSLTVSKLLDEA